MKKAYLIAVMAMVLLLGQTPVAAQNYSNAQSQAISFFPYNYCGTGQTVSWRGNCHTGDNPTGGYHDAGDHVKFGHPLAFTMATMCWADYEYGISAGTAISRGISYIENCGTSPFIYQVGDGGCDHSYWGPPENDTCARPTASTSQASCVMAGSAAALAAAYVSGNGGNLSRAQSLLSAAESALSDSGYTAASGYYNSSHFYDEMCWASIWLYLATDNETYLNKAETYLANTNYLDDYQWSHCWDDAKFGALLKLAQLTGNTEYVTLVERQLDWWLQGGGINYTSGGLPWLDQWGCLRYATMQAFMANLWADTSNVGTASKKAGYASFAQNVLGYTLGSNPRNASYVIGYGSNWPQNPHHRAACPDNVDGNCYQLTGALVGGPDSGDSYNDSIQNYQQTEVAIDYQACLIAGLASMIKTHQPPEYTTTSSTTTTCAQAAVGNGTGLTGEYFNNMNLSDPVVLTRTDATLDLSWGGGSPGTGVNSDGFSVRWTGQVQPRYTDTYIFYLMSDDGSRLWVNNQQLINDWTDHAATSEYEKSGTIALTGGTLYDIEVEYYENAGDAAIYLNWATSGTCLAKEIIPQSQLYPSGATTTSTTTTAATTSTTTTAATTSTTTTAATTSTTTTAATTSTTTTSGGSCDCGTCDWYGTDVPTCCESCSGWGWYDGGCRRSCVCPGSCPGGDTTTTTASSTSTTTTAATTSTTTTAATTSTTTTAATTSTTTTAATTSTTTTAATTSTTTTAATTSTTTTAATTTTTAAAGCTCDSGCDGTAISPNFSQNGSGQYCWQATSGTYINSWNLAKLEVNDTDYTNTFAFTSSFPAKIDGVWYIYYNSSVGWGHFELNN